MLIVLGLMVVFLGKMNSENVLSVIEEYGGRKITAQDRENAAYLSTNVDTLAGIISSKMRRRQSHNRQCLEQWQRTRRERGSWLLRDAGKRPLSGAGYIFSAWIIELFMCLLTSVRERYSFLKGYLICFCKRCLGSLDRNDQVCSALTYSSIGICNRNHFVHSNSAWSGILTIIGTSLVLQEVIYLPMSKLLSEYRRSSSRHS